MGTRKKEKETVTLLVIPHSASNTRQYSVTKTAIRAVIGLAVLCLATVMLCGYSYFQSREELAAAKTLRIDNQQKQKEIDRLEVDLMALEKETRAVVAEQEQIKKIMGVQSREKRTPSRGANRLLTQNIRAGKPSLDARAAVLRTMMRIQDREVQSLLDMAISRAKQYRAIPNLWPVRGRVTSTFGWRSSPFSHRRSEYHDGLDIAAPRGTRIKAAGEGKVIYADWKKGYGRLIQIKHANGLITWYAHNSKILVHKGDAVQKGQIISNVGSSGRSTGPHLHFSVWKNGTQINPMTYLP